jgi:PST family polysaccharide transporter
MPTLLQNDAGAPAPHRSISQNVLALYGVQVGRKLIPLVSIPYLARVLGPTGWGTVAFIAAMAEMLVICIEFGFNISATREVARNRDNPGACGKVMAGVLGAQACLATIGILLAFLVTRFIPVVANRPELLAAGLVYAVAQGFAPLWFFQGLEHMRIAAALELSGKLAALVGLFVFVHGPADDWKVLALTAVAPAISTAVGLGLAYRRIPAEFPSVASVRRALVMGGPMFLFRSAEGLYGVGNVFLLGLFTTPEIVGYFAAAEKIAKAAFGLLNPIREAIFPRLSHLAVRGGEEAAAPLARLGAAVMISGGAVLGAGLFLFAPLATRLLLGGEFAPAVDALRILSVLPLLLSITYSVGFQWLLPFGKDGVITQVILAAGLLNVALSFLLARPFLHIGMAWAVVTSEAFVAISMVAVVSRTPGKWTSTPMSAPIETGDLV